MDLSGGAKKERKVRQLPNQQSISVIYNPNRSIFKVIFTKAEKRKKGIAGCDKIKGGAERWLNGQGAPSV